jgi:tagaturonate reductase
MALAENKDFRFIVSNTTEAGITYSDSDKLSDRPANTFPGKLTQLLLKRFQLGYGGFVILPCELIDKNGDNLKKCILQYADLWELGAEFKNWIEKENIFCNTLVDRINTGYPKGEAIDLDFDDKMVNTSEYFHLWVIDGYEKLFDEIPFDKCGLNVILTNELERYRTRKVRILNGSHTSMIPYALLSGVETVGECLNNDVISAHLKNCQAEIVDSLDMDRNEALEYANSVMVRFANPYIQHKCQSIALNSVSKFKVRVLPSILEYEKKFGKTPKTLMFSFARLIEFYKKGTPNDDAVATEKLRNGTVREILADATLWGEDLSRFANEVEAL